MKTAEAKAKNAAYMRDYIKRPDVAEARKEYDAKRRQYQADRRIMDRWGMTRDEYIAFLSTGCAICGGEATHVDHCHESGTIRGALCANCNLGIGHFKDNPERLEAAAQYLDTWKVQIT